jgi:hypothetical protein
MESFFWKKHCPAQEAASSEAPRTTAMRIA